MSQKNSTRSEKKHTWGVLRSDCNVNYIYAYYHNTHNYQELSLYKECISIYPYTCKYTCKYTRNTCILEPRTCTYVSGLDLKMWKMLKNASGYLDLTLTVFISHVTIYFIKMFFNFYYCYIISGNRVY